MPDDFTRKHYAFFQNRECEYFPCHEGIAEDEFNCLFCYCPLYVLGSQCGGHPLFLKNGVKDCSSCLLPHRRGGYDFITEQYPRIIEAMRKLEDCNLG